MWRTAKVVRDPALQHFLDVTAQIVAGSSNDLARIAARHVFTAVNRRAGAPSAITPQRLPVCEQLPSALSAAANGTGDVPALAAAFLAIEPSLCWRRRDNIDPTERQFHDGHANAMIAGPGGIEERDDVWIGVSLMASNLTYVDHHHPPKEVYVALTEGEWWNAGMDWTEPGPGGIIYNPPGILHTMRSHDKPFLAVWLLPIVH